MPTSKKAVKINRRRKTSLKNKKYYAGDYSEQIINGTPVKCIYPDSSDKSIAAMLGFRKNCSAIPGFTPPVNPIEEKPVEDVVTPTQVDFESMSNSVPEETAPSVAPAPIQEETAPAPIQEEAAPAPAPMMMPMFYTNVKQPKGGSKRKSKKSKKSSKNNSKKSKKSKK
jgi:hypothetical protein